tara:strand:+ start:677 stop:805 length:129 start_codon:yes stop_codon:yes gene_type:complete
MEALIEYLDKFAENGELATSKQTLGTGLGTKAPQTGIILTIL